MATCRQLGYGSSAMASTGLLGGVGKPFDLTTTWGVGGAYEHHWNKQWQTSLYGVLHQIQLQLHRCNALLCAASKAHCTGAAVAGCNNDLSYWDIGSRTQFNVDSQTYIGLDVIYTALNQANGGWPCTSAKASQPLAARTLSDQSAFMAEFRFHRNFYP